jgi:hypothetical protein
MTTLEVADVQAVEGLKVVEQAAIAALLQIGRGYDAAMEEISFIATNRERVLAPGVRPEPARPVPATPLNAVAAGTPVSPALPIDLIPEPRMSPLVEALHALQEAEDPELVEEPARVDAVAAPAVVYPVTGVVTLPRIEARVVEREWAAGRHAEAKTDQIPVQAA